jgi:YegS/Rv2252/BmrU family lipid kinase
VTGLLVIVNGRVARHRWWGRAEAQLRTLFGNGVEIRYTRGRGDATLIARAALENGSDWIVAAGGDGTINEAVNGFFDCERRVRPGAALSFLACGTANDWVRTLRSPLRLRDAIDALPAARPGAVDVGIARCRGRDGAACERVFLNFAEAGVGSEVIRRVERRKDAYLPTAVRAAFSYLPRRFDLTLDRGESMSVGPLLSLIVAGGRYFGSGIKVAPMASPDDGLLEVITLGDFSRFEILRKISKFARGRYFDEPKVNHYSVRELTAVSPDPVSLILDGEIAGELPVTIRVAPRALKIRS